MQSQFMAFAHALRVEISATGLSQHEFATRSKVSLPVVAKLLAGKSASVSSIGKLIAFFGGNDEVGGGRKEARERLLKAYLSDVISALELPASSAEKLSPQMVSPRGSIILHFLQSCPPADIEVLLKLSEAMRQSESIKRMTFELAKLSDEHCETSFSRKSAGKQKPTSDTAAISGARAFTLPGGTLATILNDLYHDTEGDD